MEVFNSLFPGRFETVGEFAHQIFLEKSDEKTFILKSVGFSIIKFREKKSVYPDEKQCRQIYMAHLMTDEELNFQNVSCFILRICLKSNLKCLFM